MIGNIFKVLISVKAKLFFGFLSMAIIISLLGGYAFLLIGGAGTVVKETFDRPLMAINFARSAGQVFSELEIEVLQQISQSEGANTFNAERILPLTEKFKEDLSVAKERSISSRATAFFSDVDRDILEWETIIISTDRAVDDAAITRAQNIADTIEENLDIIVELQTNESFRARERSIEQMKRLKTYNLGAMIAALILTLLLSAWIAVTIINPLKAAAIAARKISAGNFNVDIPPGGDDETGVLLKTMSAMQKNIRDRMGQEQNLRSLAQHRLADSLDNSQDAILLTDGNGLIIVANQQIGKTFPALKSIDLLHRPYSNFFEDTGRPLNDPCEYDSNKSEIKFNDGRWARVSASDTQEGGRLYIWSDISEAKHRSQKLREAKNAAEEADKAKTVFLATMSHELRTPLNAVIGFSDILETHYKTEGGAPEHAEMAGLISKSGAHLLNIVKDVLSVSKGVDTHDMQMNMTDVDMAEVVSFCMKTIAGEAVENNIRTLWMPPASAYYVKGDTLRLQQLVLNLLSNAIKYNRHNGAIKVQLSESEGHQVRLDVIDTGIGISKADVTKITEPFYQVEAGHKRKFDGVGLGLTIVNQILLSHDGKLQVQSQLDKGTVMTVLLPSLTNFQSEPAKGYV